MTTFLLIVILLLSLALGAFIIIKRVLDARLARAVEANTAEVLRNKAALQALKDQYAQEAQRVQADYEQRVAAIELEAERIRSHYEIEARQAQEAANEAIMQAQANVDALSKYASLRDAEAEVKAKLEAAINEAAALQQEGNQYLEQAKQEALHERAEAQQRAKDIHSQAETPPPTRSQAALFNRMEDDGRLRSR